MRRGGQTPTFSTTITYSLSPPQESQSLDFVPPYVLTYQILAFKQGLGVVFLDPQSGLRFDKTEAPQLCVNKDTDVLLVADRELEWALPSSVSISESRWLLMLSGIAPSDLRPEGVFVALDQRRFVNAHTGKVFATREEAVASLPAAFAEDWRGFVLLLEAGDRMPKWRLPSGPVRPRVWLRKDCAAEIRGGAVRTKSREAPKLGESAWLALAEDSKLVKAFARAARKGAS